VVSLANLREVIFSHAFTAKVKKIMKNPAAPQSTGGGSSSLKTYVFSAKGAAFIFSLGQRPEKIIDAEHQR
jgi:hypothetical protein